ncbi:YgaB family protein [Peribacillus sp. SCS-37]|uniref:YgaB family protein n=1 Tax=Paraperibacillus esterisolvens TaxID=3115296 RepID=UPI0039059287
MKRFDYLVNEQLKTMERLLYLQTELERCQDIEQELDSLDEGAELAALREEMDLMKINLRSIQKTFENQTEEVIRSYQEAHLNTI